MLLLIAVFFYGFIHQSLSITECAPGTPEMSITALFWAGVGGTICNTPPSTAGHGNEPSQ
jgi:hypothetical protein